jgi:hypothetical protein
VLKVNDTDGATSIELIGGVLGLGGQALSLYSDGSPYVVLSTTTPSSFPNAISVGGSTSAGYVLTDVAGDGVASWQAPTGGAGMGIGNAIADSTWTTVTNYMLFQDESGNLGAADDVSFSSPVSYDGDGLRVGSGASGYSSGVLTIAGDAYQVDGGEFYSHGFLTPDYPDDGRVIIGTGSVSTPTISTYDNLGNYNNGIWFPEGGQEIGFATQGVERVRISSTTGVTIQSTATVGGFKMTTGASSGYVLTSDADGDASWAAATGGSADIGKSFKAYISSGTLEGWSSPTQEVPFDTQAWSTLSGFSTTTYHFIVPSTGTYLLTGNFSAYEDRSGDGVEQIVYGWRVNGTSVQTMSQYMYYVSGETFSFAESPTAILELNKDDEVYPYFSTSDVNFVVSGAVTGTSFSVTRLR